MYGVSLMFMREVRIFFWHFDLLNRDIFVRESNTNLLILLLSIIGSNRTFMRLFLLIIGKSFATFSFGHSNRLRFLVRLVVIGILHPIPNIIRFISLF
jgi:hypothetical protein